MIESAGTRDAVCRQWRSKHLPLASTFFTLLLGATGLLACSSSSPAASDTPNSASTAGPGDVVSTPESSVTCSEVCANVSKCGVASTRCAAVCPTLSLACQGCLAKATCQDGCVAETCGNIASSPKKDPKPLPTAQCDPLTFAFSTNAPTDSPGPAGHGCTVPWECSSHRCVSGHVGGKSVGFCAAESDCRENDPALSDICPAGWKCAEIPDNRSATATTRHTCVPPYAKPCAPGQLEYQ